MKAGKVGRGQSREVVAFFLPSFLTYFITVPPSFPFASFFSFFPLSFSFLLLFFLLPLPSLPIGEAELQLGVEGAHRKAVAGEERKERK